MKLIPLTQGKVTQVDGWSYEFLMHWKWYALKNGNTYYALRRNITVDGKREVIYMHHLIMATPKGLQTDHIDRDGLNNQEYNMRNCTSHQNCMNRGTFGEIKYHGVVHDKRGFIKAHIQLSGIGYHLGYFKTDELAARAYDKKAKELFKEFANLNFPND